MTRGSAGAGALLFFTVQTNVRSYPYTGLVTKGFHDYQKGWSLEMTHITWNSIEKTIDEHYGKNPPLEILERFASEKVMFRGSANILDMLRFLSRLRSEVKSGEGDLWFHGQTNNLFIAWLIGATNINPLPPHYYCPKCKKVEFVSDVVDGWDLPDAKCECGEEMEKDGHNLPFSLLDSRINSVEVVLPSSMRSRIGGLLREVYEEQGVANVFKVHYETNEEEGAARYALVPDWESEGLPENRELIIGMDSFVKRFRKNMHFVFIFSEELDLIQKYAKETKRIPKGAEFLDKSVLSAFKQGGKYRPYLNYLRGCILSQEALLGFGHNAPRNHDLQYYIDNYELSCFSDLLHYAGLAHGTFTPNDEVPEHMLQTLPRAELITHREDVFHYVKQKVVKRGIFGDGLAVSIAEKARRGLYAEERLDESSEQMMSAIGMNDEYIEKLTGIRYLLPRGHSIDYLRVELKAAWYAVNSPETFAAWSHGMLSDFLKTDEPRLVLLASRPAMGKTAFAFELVEELTTKRTQPILYVSAESSEDFIREELKRRSINADRSLLKILSSEEPLQISEIVARIKEEENTRVVVVDYLQLIATSSNASASGARNASILNELKRLADEKKIFILVLAQLGKKLEIRSSKVPILSDVEFADPEMVSDDVLFLYRESYYEYVPYSSFDDTRVIVARSKSICEEETALSFYREKRRFVSCG